MPTKSHMESQQKEDGTTAEALVVEFSNGSLEQLRDLAKFFNIKEEDPYKVLELAIGFLETVRESNGKKSKNPTVS